MAAEEHVKDILVPLLPFASILQKFWIFWNWTVHKGFLVLWLRIKNSNYNSVCQPKCSCGLVFTSVPLNKCPLETWGGCFTKTPLSLWDNSFILSEQWVLGMQNILKMHLYLWYQYHEKPQFQCDLYLYFKMSTIYLANQPELYCLEIPI